MSDTEKVITEEELHTNPICWQYRKTTIQNLKLSD